MVIQAPAISCFTDLFSLDIEVGKICNVTKVVHKRYILFFMLINVVKIAGKWLVFVLKYIKIIIIGLRHLYQKEEEIHNILLFNI